MLHTFTVPDHRNLVSDSGLHGLVRILKQYDKNASRPAPGATLTDDSVSTTGPKPVSKRHNERATRQQFQLLSLAAETMYFNTKQIAELTTLFPTEECVVMLLCA